MRHTFKPWLWCMAATTPPPSPPELASVQPDLIDTDGGIPVELGGTDLTNASSVKINGVSCTEIVVVSSGLVRCLSPAGLTVGGPYDVTITTPGGSSTLVAAVEVWEPVTGITSGTARVYDQDVSVTSSRLDNWLDDGADGKDLAGTSVSRPHDEPARFGDNTRRSLTFKRADNSATGDELFLESPISFGGHASHFWVSKTVLGRYNADSGTVVGKTGGAIMSAQFDTGRLEFYDANAGIPHVTGPTLAFNDGSPRVYGATQNVSGNEFKSYINGTLALTDTCTSGTPSWQYVGGAQVNDPFDGELACLVIVEATITTTEAVKLSKWMYGKFVARSVAFTRVANTTAWPARDGAGIVALPDVTLMLCGWNPSGSDGPFNGGTSRVTNENWGTTDKGATWTLLLAEDHTYPNLTRPTPRHMAGWLRIGAYAYVIGSDPFNGPDGYYPSGDGPGTADVFRTLDGITFELMTAAAEFGPRCHHMVGERVGVIYVMGGQTDPNDPSTALNDVWKSTNGGANFTQIADAPWDPRGLVCSPLPTLNGKIWLAGGGTYDPIDANRTFFNDVWSFNGTSWVKHTGDSGAPWVVREYNQTIPFDGRLYLFNGANLDGNIGDCWTWTTVDDDEWIEQTIVPWRTSHADGMAALDDRILYGPGNGCVGQGSDEGLGKVFSITRNGVVPPTIADPVLASIDVSAATQWRDGVTLTATGSSLDATSKIRVDGVEVTTAYVDATTLTCDTLTINRVAGDRLITVHTPGAANESGSVTYTVTAWSEASTAAGVPYNDYDAANYDATTGTWTDTYGHGNLAQANAGRRPTKNAIDAAYNNLPTVESDGTQWCSGTNAASNVGDQEIWVMVGQGSVSGGRIFDNCNTTNGITVEPSVDGMINQWAPVVIVPGVTYLETHTTANAPSAMIADFLGASSAFYLQDFTTPIATGTLGAPTGLSKVTAFGSDQGGANALAIGTGSIARWIIYRGSTPLSAGDRESMKNKFSYLYGIAIT